MPFTANLTATKQEVRSRAAAPSMPPSATGALARLAVARAAASGIDVQPCLSRAGLSERQIKNRHARIGATNQAALVGLLAEALEDDLFGFHLGQSFELGEIGLLYYVMASAPTLRDALCRAERYAAITNEGIAPIYSQSGEVRVSYVGMAPHAARHQVEFWMTGLIRVAQQLTSLRLSPIHLTLCHPRHAGAREIEAFLGCAIAFDALVDEVQFPSAAGNAVLTGADPYLHDLLLGYSEEALAHRVRLAESLRTRVENAVMPLLPHGRPRISEIARALGTSQRTLSRRLTEEGLSFENVLEEMRRDLALRYLRDTRLSISRIAWLLGFREATAFTHAFRRWTGRSPTEARVERDRTLNPPPPQRSS
ncbi:AraC family transcriptional regulator [Methylorubrum zatmanii]|nr:AraC family transcriptional regulator [Methylorubrum zatmanii]ARO54925.1 AraC family transcriptional regulator [Methylorubrum zatmanii]